MSTSAYVSPRPPRGADTQAATVAGFTHKKEKGYHYLVVEKRDVVRGGPDLQAQTLQSGYELAEEGPAESLYRIPLSLHEQTEQGYRDEANARLRSRAKMALDRSSATASGDTVEIEETVNRTEVRELSGAELVAGMKE